MQFMQFCNRGGRFFYIPRSNVVTPDPPDGQVLLLENGENIFLEDGSDILLEG